MDFNFVDLDNGTLSSVKITTLESAGSLQLNGNEVTLNTVVLASDIAAGHLRFIPQENANGTNYASFGFRVNDGIDNSVKSYTMTVDITPVNDAPDGIVTITGEPRVGQMLTAVNMLSDNDSLGILTYQWYRNDNAIVDATNNSYLVVSDDVAKSIHVVISYLDGDGTLETQSSTNLFILTTSDVLIESSASQLSQTAHDTALNAHNVQTVVTDEIASSTTPDIVVKEVAKDSLNFTDALAAKQPIEVLKSIAGNAIKTTLLDDSSSILRSNKLAKDIIQQAINAREQPKNIGIIASGMINAAFDVDNSSGVIIGIVQQIAELSLSTIEVSQLLSQMIIESDDNQRTVVIQVVINEPNLNKNHMVQIFNELNETSPKLAEEFSQQVQSTSRIDNTLLEGGETTAQTGLLATLKAKLFGIKTEQIEVASYNEKQQMYQLKLAKAKILAMANNVNNNREVKAEPTDGYTTTESTQSIGQKADDIT
jgi:hypothetical protein